MTDTISYLGYKIIQRSSHPNNPYGRGRYFLWSNGQKGKLLVELGFFSSIDQTKRSIQIHKDTGKFVTESDLQ